MEDRRQDPPRVHLGEKRRGVRATARFGVRKKIIKRSATTTTYGRVGTRVMSRHSHIADLVVELVS